MTELDQQNPYEKTQTTMLRLRREAPVNAVGHLQV
jgi:chromosome condensin MukBEF MukE localization factor